MYNKNLEISTEEKEVSTYFRRIDLNVSKRSHQLDQSYGQGAYFHFYFLIFYFKIHFLMKISHTKSEPVLSIQLSTAQVELPISFSDSNCLLYIKFIVNYII